MSTIRDVLLFYNHAEQPNEVFPPVRVEFDRQFTQYLLAVADAQCQSLHINFGQLLNLDHLTELHVSAEAAYAKMTEWYDDFTSQRNKND